MKTKFLCALIHIRTKGEVDTVKLFKVKKEGNDQESTQSSSTTDSGYQWESDNFTIRHHK